jgi:hypothetical protein
MKKNNKEPRRYPHVIPIDYLKDLAQQLCKNDISDSIAFNVLKDVYSLAYTRGYTRRQDESIRFKQQQESHLNDDFYKFKDELDDRIHEKKTA